MIAQLHRLFAALSAAALVAATPAAQGSLTYDEALARYRACQQRKPFHFHVDGRQTLARTRSPQALAVLAEDYAKNKTYTEHSRYVLASLFGEYFATPESTPTFAALRKDHQKPVDTWLWAMTLRIHTDAHGDAEALAVATTAKEPLHRAAAILALGESNRGNMASAIVANCVEFPKKEADRMAVLGAMTGALYTQRKRVNDEEYRAALRAYIGLLADDVKLPHIAKVQIARHLQWILNGPALFVSAEPWLEILERGEIKQRSAQGTTAQPRFFGIETEGERFVYVVDMSDSMCKEITPDARPAGPITGPKPKKSKSMVLDESDLPWHTIRTRWDLAREQLRISLSRLPPEKSFAIVWFGTDAGLFEATKGLVKASRSNIGRAMDELDSIKPGPVDPVKAPDGQLRGKTNMHSGLRIAFGLTGRGIVDEHSYVAAGPLTEGCDTIFLLSDGAPTTDGFELLDRDYGEGNVVVDQEYGAAAQRTPQIYYPGPYSMPDWLLADLRRLNAFRRIRLHCIGLGEANFDLLRRMAEVGNGELFVVGKGKSSGAGGSSPR